MPAAHRFSEARSSGGRGCGRNERPHRPFSAPPPVRPEGAAAVLRRGLCPRGQLLSFARPFGRADHGDVRVTGRVVGSASWRRSPPRGALRKSMRGLSRYFKTGPVFMTGWILHTVRRLRSRQMCSTIVRLHLNRPLRLPFPAASTAAGWAVSERRVNRRRRRRRPLQRCHSRQTAGRSPPGW